jgi:hypothetical protein
VNRPGPARATPKFQIRYGHIPQSTGDDPSKIGLRLMVAVAADQPQDHGVFERVVAGGGDRAGLDMARHALECVLFLFFWQRRLDKMNLANHIGTADHIGSLTHMGRPSG